MQDENQTAHTAAYAMLGAIAVAILFGTWLMLAPADRSLESASKPAPAATENTGTSSGNSHPRDPGSAPEPPRSR